MKIEVIGIDHIYVAVSDLGRSEKFYDVTMTILGFHKNSFLNDGDPHLHYFNRHFGFVLRPARSSAPHDPFAAGSIISASASRTTPRWTVQRRALRRRE